MTKITPKKIEKHGHIRTDNEPGEQNQEAEGSLALEPRMTMGTTGSFVHEAELNAPS